MLFLSKIQESFTGLISTYKYIRISLLCSKLMHITPDKHTIQYKVFKKIAYYLLKVDSVV